MNICDYGCGKEAIQQFKNGKWCCSKNHKSCSNLTYPTKNNIGKTECPYCKNLFANNRIKQHMIVCIKYNKCLQCGKETKNPKFCNASCSAIFNNAKRKVYRYPKFTDDFIEKIILHLIDECFLSFDEKGIYDD